MGLKNRQENWNSGEGEGENISCVVVGGPQGSIRGGIGVGNGFFQNAHIHILHT